MSNARQGWGLRQPRPYREATDEVDEGAESSTNSCGLEIPMRYVGCLSCPSSRADRLPGVNVVMGSGPREGGVLGEAAARRVKRSRLGRVHGYDPVTVMCKDSPGS